MIRIQAEQPVTVYRASDHYCNQAIVIQKKGGDLIAIFNEERGYAHMDNGYTSIVHSTNGGRSWDPQSRTVVLPATDVEGNWDPAIAELSDGTLMINLCQTAYFKRGMDWEAPQYDAAEFGTLRGWLGTYVLKSTDSGATWSRPVPVNTRPIKHGGTRVGVLELPDGGLLLPMYGRMQEYGYFGSGETTRAYMVRSDDGGSNWEYYSTVAYDAAHINAFSEPAPLRLNNGLIVCMMRSHIIPTKRPDNMYMAVSEDDGHTFGPTRRLGVWGYPAQLINLQDGRVLMTFGYRRNEFGVKALISNDGLTWDANKQFSLHEGGTAERSERTWWHTGYPCSAQLPDGTILTVYHAFSKGERPVQYIESVRWTLPD